MPKISVLMPLYNRRHYVEDSIGSVLIQTLRDWELIVCDDGSTDGSFEFVAERFAAEISAGKLKLLRNEKNLGEFPTDNRLIREARGKYIMLLHSDDLLLNTALEHMNDAAEFFGADVVHAGLFLKSPANGIIDANTPFKVMCWENHRVKNFETVPDDPATRFNEWASGDTFIDAPYNIFRREFLLGNDILFPERCGNLLFCLHWLMKAKVYVKTPEIFYVNRDSPDSQTNDRSALNRRPGNFIRDVVLLTKYFDRIFDGVDYFDEATRYKAKAIFYNRFDEFEINRLKIYERGLSPELHRGVERAIKDNFGDCADYVTFLFHKLHCLPFGQDYRTIGGSNAFH